MSAPSTVYFVGRDFSAYGELRLLTRELNAADSFFSSAERFFEELDPSLPGCVVLESRDADGSVEEFIDRLNRSGCFYPVIVLAGDEAGGIDRAVGAIKCGAADFIAMPFDPQRLRLAVESLLKRAAAIHDICRLREKTAARYRTLTTRERQVLELVVSGKPTKNIAHELGTSRNTVQNQRASILKKMQARSVVDIVRLTILMQLGESLLLRGHDWQTAEVDLFLSLAAEDARAHCDGAYRAGAA